MKKKINLELIIISTVSLTILGIKLTQLLFDAL